MKKCEICERGLTTAQRRACSKSCAGKLNKDRKRWRITNGYKEIYHPSHDRKNKYIREHVLVMSEFLGRTVKYPENIHHIDGDKLNNNISNLVWFPNVSGHSRLHKQMERLVQEMYKDGLVEYKHGQYQVKKL